MSNDRDRLVELLGIVLVSVLAAILLLGVGLALPAEAGARLSHGRWLPLDWVVLWRVGWRWITTMRAGAMVGWPATDRRWLPDARLYAAFLVLEIVLFLSLSISGSIAGVRAWNATHGPALSSRAKLARTGNAMPRSHRRGA
jgi:hypothetical protein